jgi:RNA-directed DNA polymerase
MNRQHLHIQDVQVLRLIRAYLYVGIMDSGIVMKRGKGTPQGGPLSPLLANVLLDEVDKALEKRGHCFARYADDCNVYVGSKKAGERVMAYLRKLYDGLKLQINEAKSAVGSAFGRKFLGYALWVGEGEGEGKGKGKEVKCKVADKALQTFKTRVRQITCRSGGRSLKQVVEKLRLYLSGWRAYFELAQTPNIWRKLDEWLRHRLRAIQLKHWRKPTTIYRALKALGATDYAGAKVAAYSRCWWHNSDRLIKTVLTISCFDQLGVPRLS